MNIDDLRRSTITFEAKSFGHICKSREGSVVLQNSKNSHIWHVANTLDKDATPSADLPQSLRKFPTTKWTFPLTCNSSISYKADFSWQGSLNIRMRYPENGWYEENNYIAFASTSFREKNNNKKSLPRASATAVRYHFPSFMTQSCISLCRK